MFLRIVVDPAHYYPQRFTKGRTIVSPWHDDYKPHGNRLITEAGKNLTMVWSPHQRFQNIDVISTR